MAVAVGNADRDDRDLAGRDFDVFELGEIERVVSAFDGRRRPIAVG
jgi:hypothetical protein